MPGNPTGPGRSYRPKGRPAEVGVRDPPKPGRGRAVPYGASDIAGNPAWVSVGVGRGAAGFAVEAVRRWWPRLGRERHREVARLSATADGGGGGSPRSRPRKPGLRALAGGTGLVIEVCHYPPGTGKGNGVEHRPFCHITRDRAGEPLETAEVVVESVARTTTGTGLEVHARSDEKTYAKGRKVGDRQPAECNTEKHRFHGEWNYEVHPRE